VTRVFALLHRATELHVVRIAASLGETTAVTIAAAGTAADELLQEAVSAGAVRCVRLWDDALAATDYLGVAYTLAATVRALAGDLVERPAVVVCGDRGRGAVGPALAERLGVPHLGDVVGAQVTDGRVVARRRSGPLVRLYAAKPPVVLCVAGEHRPGALTEAAGWTAAVADTEVWTLAQAGLTGAELAYRKRFRPQPQEGPRGQPKLFPDAAALAARLRDDGLLPEGS